MLNKALREPAAVARIDARRQELREWLAEWRPESVDRVTAEGQLRTFGWRVGPARNRWRLTATPYVTVELVCADHAEASAQSLALTQRLIACGWYADPRFTDRYVVNVHLCDPGETP